MRKAIVIASAILLSIYAITGITIEILTMLGALPESVKHLDAYSCGIIIVLLLVILIAASSIFKFIPAKISLIWLMIISILSPIITGIIAYLFLLAFIKDIRTIEWLGYLLLAGFGLGSMLVIIISVANIICALRPEKK